MTMQRGRAPGRIVELLEQEGRWLSAAAVARDLDLREDAARRALFRLTDRGMIEKRVNKITRQAEWRAQKGTE